MNGAQHIIEAFHRHQIDTVFGYPGGCIMPLYDALVDVVSVEHVLCRHEQGCALAADGYARASGRLGVCIATSGPGATNLITGVANAHRDSIPILVITGQVSSDLIGTDAFQETDIHGMTLGIVKHSYLVTDADELPAIMEEAIMLAQTGRPGPVWVDIPKDILLKEIASPMLAKRPAAVLPEVDIREAVELLFCADRPLLYSGGGVCLAHAETAFRTFADITGIPSVVTLKGIGNHGKHNPLHLGMLGMHGSRAANLAVAHCDLLLVIGARFDDRATGRLDEFAPNARVIHLDADSAEFHKLREVDMALQGDLNEMLKQFTQLLETSPLSIHEWQQQCTSWRTTMGFQSADTGEADAPILGSAFIRQLSNSSHDDIIVACDVGQHQMWVAQHYQFENPRHHLSSGGLGTMGYGLPAAIGAQFACPGKTVINVSGDGSFMMNTQELATIRRYKLPVKLIILDNQCLGMVRQQQELFYGNRESQINLDDNPDFVVMAQAFGIPALSIQHTDEIPQGIETLFKTEGPMLLHVAIARQENVWPIVKPGASNNEMIDVHHQCPSSTATPNHTDNAKGIAA